jgi:arylsulfatase A-like enzyme
VADRDGDGVASAFAGGDCNDRNAKVFPGAVDVPGNGLDEDCSGSDRRATGSDKKQGGDEAAKPKTAQLPAETNFLLLTIDTLRWDLGYTRDPRPDRLSPHLDALSDRSTTFERAYALASYTSKSLGPMMLGRYPAETKRTFEHFDRFSSDVPFLQERIQKAGIHTASIQGYWYFFFDGYGFERGWDHLDKSAAPKLVAIEGDRTSNGDELADQTIEHLKTLKESKERFFMWTHWVDPHTEYVPHEEFDFGSEPRERYDGEVAFVDAQIGRVLSSLKELGLDERTAIVVTSDHGEAFGEHGMIRHGFEVWEELSRVPLIVHVPGAPPRMVSERRSIIDVAPTIMETFDLKAEEGADFIRGTSLYRDALAPPDAKLEQRPVLVDMPEGPHNQERRAFYQGDYKLIVSRGRAIGLYNLREDPGEKKDLSEETTKVDEMKRAMADFVDRLDQIPATR